MKYTCTRCGGLGPFWPRRADETRDVGRYCKDCARAYNTLYRARLSARADCDIPYPETRTCGRCKMHSADPRRDFARMPSRKQGLHGWCKVCCAEYKRERRARTGRA